MDPLLLHTATAFGLAGAAGLQTTVPLLVVGLLARFDVISLSSPYDALAGNLALGGLLILSLLEIVGDKTPGLDNALHWAQLPLAGAAGAILFASQNSVVTRSSPELAILIGLLTAGSVHVARASVRAAVTPFTLGLGNFLVSFIEDLTALTLTLSAVLTPVVAVALLATILIVLGFASRWAFRGYRQLAGRR